MEKPRNEKYGIKNKEFYFSRRDSLEGKKIANLNTGKQKISKPKANGQK